jgi:hypothetical protein
MSMFEIAVVFLGTVGVAVITLVAVALVAIDALDLALVRRSANARLEESLSTARRIPERSGEASPMTLRSAPSSI